MSDKPAAPQPSPIGEACVWCNIRILAGERAVEAGVAVHDGLPVFAHTECAERAREVDAEAADR